MYLNEKFVFTSRAEVTSELTVLEDEIREVLDFQTATANERENFLRERMELFEPIVAYSLTIRRGFKLCRKVSHSISSHVLIAIIV
ncbi:hypothetical protein EAF00_005802 [Botryotinia globosa]|nr:hypothetical protein EAF00_005802 [Botryotinia globosa]